MSRNESPDASKPEVTNNYLPDVRRRIAQQMDIFQTTDNDATQTAATVIKDIVPSLDAAMKHYDDMPLLGTLAKIHSHVESIHAELDNIDAQIQSALQPPMASDEGGSGKGIFVTEVDMSSAIARIATKANTKKVQNVSDKPTSSVVMSVKDVRYAGYNAAKSDSLPAGIDTKQVLVGVCNGVELTRDADTAAWKKLMTSPECQAFVQDAFWWWFCDEFQPEKHDDQKLLFNRLAERFVNIFLAAPLRLKDESISRFHDVVAQAVFAAFAVAFPSSRAKFDEKFKLRISRNLCHWCTGAGLREGHEASHWHGRLGHALSDLQTTRAINEDVENAGSDAAALVGNVNLNFAALTLRRKKGASAPGVLRGSSEAATTPSTRRNAPPPAPTSTSNLDNFFKEAMDTLSHGSSVGKKVSRERGMVHSSGSGAAAGTPGFSAIGRVLEETTVIQEEDSALKSSDAAGNKRSFVPSLKLPAPPADEHSTPALLSSRQRLLHILDLRAQRYRSGAATERAATDRKDSRPGAATDRPSKSERLSGALTDRRERGEARGAAAVATSNGKIEQGSDSDSDASDDSTANGASEKRPKTERPKGGEVVKFNLLTNSPLIRHWLAIHSRNDTRVLQFTKLMRGGIALEISDGEDRYYARKLAPSIEIQKKVAERYNEVTREHVSKIKEIKQNVAAQKRQLDGQLAMMMREKTFHGFSNWLVASQMPAILLPKSDR